MRVLIRSFMKVFSWRAKKIKHNFQVEVLQKGKSRLYAEKHVHEISSSQICHS